MSTPYTVIAVVEAKPGKENELETALKAVVNPSRHEQTCFKYHLHKSSENPRQFFLYEHWESPEKHQEQFEKPYIKKLIEDLSECTAGPYQLFTGYEIAGE